MQYESPVNPHKKPVNWPITIFMLLFHVGAVVALFNFSWEALVVSVLMIWITAGLGISMGYHRLLTHRAFTTPKVVEYFLTICGALALEGGAISWVARHRLHHARPDQDDDPHSPRHGLWWSHLGWVVNGESDHSEVQSLMRYAQDLAKDRFHLWLSRWNFVPQIFLFGILYWAGGWQFIWWGICARVVYVWHATGFVNSLGHVIGRRRFETPDNSRNMWWLALFTFGENWHNNHHAHPASARHGLAWYEMDISWYVIWTMKKLGLIRKIRVAELPERSSGAGKTEETATTAS
jgi:stearoyl-CoA desaturase (delta-9 desaturase)